MAADDPTILIKKFESLLKCVTSESDKKMIKMLCKKQKRYLEDNCKKLKEITCNTSESNGKKDLNDLNKLNNNCSGDFDSTLKELCLVQLNMQKSLYMAIKKLKQYFEKEKIKRNKNDTSDNVENRACTEKNKSSESMNSLDKKQIEKMRCLINKIMKIRENILHKMSKCNIESNNDDNQKTYKKYKKSKTEKYQNPGGDNKNSIDRQQQYDYSRPTRDKRDQNERTNVMKNQDQDEANEQDIQRHLEYCQRKKLAKCKEVCCNTLNYFEDKCNLPTSQMCQFDYYENQAITREEEAKTPPPPKKKSKGSKSNKKVDPQDKSDSDYYYGKPMVKDDKHEYYYYVKPNEKDKRNYNYVRSANQEEAKKSFEKNKKISKRYKEKDQINVKDQNVKDQNNHLNVNQICDDLLKPSYKQKLPECPENDRSTQSKQYEDKSYKNCKDICIELEKCRDKFERYQELHLNQENIPPVNGKNQRQLIKEDESQKKKKKKFKIFACCAKNSKSNINIKPISNLEECILRTKKYLESCQEVGGKYSKGEKNVLFDNICETEEEEDVCSLIFKDDLTEKKKTELDKIQNKKIKNSDDVRKHSKPPVSKGENKLNQKLLPKNKDVGRQKPVIRNEKDYNAKKQKLEVDNTEKLKRKKAKICLSDDVLNKETDIKLKPKVKDYCDNENRKYKVKKEIPSCSSEDFISKPIKVYRNSNRPKYIYDYPRSNEEEQFPIPQTYKQNQYRRRHFDGTKRINSGEIYLTPEQSKNNICSKLVERKESNYKYCDGEGIEEDPCLPGNDIEKVQQQQEQQVNSNNDNCTTENVNYTDDKAFYNKIFQFNELFRKKCEEICCREFKKYEKTLSHQNLQSLPIFSPSRQLKEGNTQNCENEQPISPHLSDLCEQLCRQYCECIKKYVLSEKPSKNMNQ